jgi:hypothetical protein
MRADDGNGLDSYFLVVTEPKVSNTLGKRSTLRYTPAPRGWMTGLQTETFRLFLGNGTSHSLNFHFEKIVFIFSLRFASFSDLFLSLVK